MANQHPAQQALYLSIVRGNLVLKPDPATCVAQVWQASQDLQPIFAGIDQLVGQNLRRVQSAMRRHRVGPHHFSGSTGYGHGDLGREAFDLVSWLLSPFAMLKTCPLVLVPGYAYSSDL